MGTRYNRSDIIDFSQLDESDQSEMVDKFGQDAAEESSYVEFTADGGKEILSLLDFMRSDGKFWSGICGQSYFSAYFLRLSNCGTQAVIAYRHF